MMGCMHSLTALSFSLVALLLISCCCKCEGRDSISVGEPLKESDKTLVSAEGRFELGFFDCNGGKYLGIWYFNVSPRTIMWVARRDAPLPASCGGVRISKDNGNVEVECGNGELHLVTSLARSAGSNRTLQLLDSGNLVLVDASSGARVWQSFDEPTDTFLPGMKLSDTVKLSSWMDHNNPAIGNYSFLQEQGVYVIYERSFVYWKNNEPSSFMKNALPNLIDYLLSGSTKSGKTGLNISSVTPDFNNSRLVMNSSGQIQYYNLSNGVSWSSVWPAPDDPCSVYNTCGKFGVCNSSGTSMMHNCTCPYGFTPVSSEDWNAGIYSDGCDRVPPAECSRRKTFVKIPLVRVGGGFKPITEVQDEKTCENECLTLNDCKCHAYYFDFGNSSAGSRGTGKNSSRCWIWTSDVENLNQGDGVDAASINLFLRISGGSFLLIFVAILNVLLKLWNSAPKYLKAYDLNLSVDCVKLEEFIQIKC